jgi:TRAP-type C4-dicarboxylate transport system permease small subunit
MKAKQLVAIVLIVAGTLGLIYRGFNYTRETHETKVGSFELSISRRTRIDVPMWASLGLIVVGVGILVLRSE